MIRKLILVLGLCLVAPAAHAGTGSLVLGAQSNPPKGPGPGKVFLVNTASMQMRDMRFAKAGTRGGNSFYAGYNGATGRIYVPSPVGRVTILDASTGHRTGSFPVIRGARLAHVVRQRNLLLVLSAKYLAAYRLGTHRPVFTLAVGGNAMAVNRNETRLYVGGNMDRSITAISLPNGRVTGSYPVGHSGDLVLADGHLFSADMKTGVMSVIDMATGHVTRLKTPEIDPDFSYHAIPHATAGFMQLATSPDGKRVYAAGFSGHVLTFSAQKPSYLGEIAVQPKPGANKLSGIAIVNGGKDALVTVENRHEAALVRLQNGRILHLFTGVASNRWVIARRMDAGPG